MGELFAGRYEFVDLLGDGGMGTVWRVWDHRDQHYRAAKVLKQSDSASLLRFVRETFWRIDHDHLITPIGWSAEDDRVLFTMPLVDGGTVATLLRDFGALPGIWVGDLISQLLEALQAVHRSGLVHRDVKPGNLLLDATGTARPRLRLTDFGIAAPVDDPRLTRVGEVIGTPGYQAPEAARGADPEPRQDLYSVGVVAVELLTGIRPDAVPGTVQPVELSGIGDSSLAPIIERLVQPDPEQRYPDAAAVSAALRGTVPTATDRQGADDIEVFNQLPELPDGWTPFGPVQAPGSADGTSSTALPADADQPAVAQQPTIDPGRAIVDPGGSPADARLAAEPVGSRRADGRRMMILLLAIIAAGLVMIIISALLLTS